MAIYDVHGYGIADAYNMNGIIIINAYSIDGEIVYTRGSSVDYDDYTVSSFMNISVANCQGVAVYNDVLFQFRAGSGISDTVCLFDFTDGSDIMRDMTIKSDHADSATFSNEFYSNDDEFPLLYVTSDTTPAKVYVDRVTRSSAELIKTLVFPQSAGYYGAAAFDWSRGECFLLAYKENNYLSDNGGANKTVVSKWDLNTLTNNGDETFTPAFISQYERDFIYCMQGLAYHDGLIWIASGYYGAGTSYIYSMHPDTGQIAHTITMPDNTEIEGVAFIGDYMLIGQQGGVYKKCTFAEI